MARDLAEPMSHVEGFARTLEELEIHSATTACLRFGSVRIAPVDLAQISDALRI